MKNIKEIFESNPDILETKEVKELIEQFHFQFKAIQKKQRNYFDKVTDVVFNSELFLKDGISCKKCIEKIAEISFPQ